MKTTFVFWIFLWKQNLSYILASCAHVCTCQQHVTRTSTNTTSCGQIQLSFSSCWCPKGEAKRAQDTISQVCFTEEAPLHQELGVEPGSCHLNEMQPEEKTWWTRLGWRHYSTNRTWRKQKHGSSVHVRICSSHCSIGLAHKLVGARASSSPIY